MGPVEISLLEINALGVHSIFLQQKKPKSLERVCSSYFAPLFTALQNRNVNKMIKSRKPNKKNLRLPLNRNLVLHGTDNNYDRKENSLRAIAGLDFVLWLCVIADEIDEKQVK